MYARGTIVGLTRSSNRFQILRAAIESIAYQSKDIFEAIKSDSGLSPSVLKADGGASVSNILMSFQADILGCRVIRPKITESTAIGAVYLAGLAAGIWQSKEDIQTDWKSDREFIPSISEERRNFLYNGWKKAVERSRNWAR